MKKTIARASSLTGFSDECIGQPKQLCLELLQLDKTNLSEKYKVLLCGKSFMALLQGRHQFKNP